MSTTTRGRRAQAKAAFDEEIARMKRREEAAGQWCTCGHSLPTHDVGFTCQFRDCSCLNFKPCYAPAPATAQTESGYKTLEQCAADKTHLQSVDRDGYCNECGEQDAAPTPTQGEHTPLPWRVVPIGSQRYVESDAGFVCDMQRDSCENEAEIATSDANAAFIVKAVNNHAKLVAALRELVAADNCNYERDTMRSEGMFDRARKLLTEVQKA